MLDEEGEEFQGPESLGHVFNSVVEIYGAK
jgi:hypothetical protein